MPHFVGFFKQLKEGKIKCANLNKKNLPKYIKLNKTKLGYQKLKKLKI